MLEGDAGFVVLDTREYCLNRVFLRRNNAFVFKQIEVAVQGLAVSAVICHYLFVVGRFESLELLLLCCVQLELFNNVAVQLRPAASLWMERTAEKQKTQGA